MPGGASLRPPIANAPRGAWQPILEGRLAERADVAVRAITESLDGPLPGQAEAGTGAALTARFASVGRGRAGVALFYGYLARAGGILGGEETAARLLAEAVDAMAHLPPSVSLYSGVTGVAWAASHLRNLSGRQLPTLTGEDELTTQVDDHLSNRLRQSAWAGDFELMQGLVGVAVYALERSPHPAAAECLELAIDHLDKLAEIRPEGITWWTSPALTLRPDRFPDGYYSLGLAHGVAGVIAALAQACAANVARAKARRLLDGAVAWLLAQRLPELGLASFPGWIRPGVQPKPARLAWCYGDLGIAAALLLAARCVGEAAWETQARAIARGAAARPPEQSGVVDAALCHGAAGVGHVFNRLFQATGEQIFFEAARFWLERVLALRRPGQILAGYSMVKRRPGGAQQRIAYRGVLQGAAGVGLALLAATTPIEPAWDRLLLLSGPP